MLRTDFDYYLPEDLIAQTPLEERDRSRMLILDRAQQNWRDGGFTDLPSLVAPGDLLVLNNTRVFSARLVGHRILNGARSAEVEALLLKRTSETENEWEVLAKPGRALKVGTELEFGDGLLHGTVREIAEEGRRIIRFTARLDEFERIVDQIGSTPLPPYIRRDRGIRLDEPRYQTVYAKQRGAIAAPTAGLHFTPQVMEQLRERGIETAEITHHVGYATFQPIRVERVEEHRIAAESYVISDATADKIELTRTAGGRIIAVGTTSVRALESAAAENGRVRAGSGTTELFIYPSYKFRVVDALLTNFHLPQSSLLMLVAAFAGREFVIEAYCHAVAAKYRFYSYGDCMLIL